MSLQAELDGSGSSLGYRGMYIPKIQAKVRYMSSKVFFCIHHLCN